MGLFFAKSSIFKRLIAISRWRGVGKRLRLVYAHFTDVNKLVKLGNNCLVFEALCFSSIFLFRVAFPRRLPVRSIFPYRSVTRRLGVSQSVLRLPSDVLVVPPAITQLLKICCFYPHLDLLLHPLSFFYFWNNSYNPNFRILFIFAIGEPEFWKLFTYDVVDSYLGFFLFVFVFFLTNLACFCFS